MAQETLSAGTTRKRVFFGLFDSDGWAWAGVKAVFWFVVLIMMLGYLPDRAYYFTVFATIDLGLNPAVPPASHITPINLCPASNGSMPCPVPAGAMLPWQPSPEQIALPAGRTDGAAVQYGTKLLYIGGSDGQAASADVSIAEIVEGSTFDAWKPGPTLPEPRSGAAVLFSNGSIFLVGGSDASGQPTTSVWSLTPDQNGTFTDWKVEDTLVLPEPRTGATLVAGTDGLILVGGSGADGKPTTTVWKSTLDKSGKLTAWVDNAALPDARTEAEAFLVGDYLWVYGGADADGPTATTLRGTLESPPVPDGSPPGTLAPATFISAWATTSGAANLPAPRSDAAGFMANGAMYLVGGTDGSSTKGDVWWTVPSAQGDIEAWHSLSQTDLPAPGLAGAAAAVSGGTVFLVGGTSGDGILASTVRANLSPADPFFQLGPLGATVPGLKIEGEIGQQLGYLNAAGVGTVDFIILVLIGWAFAHKERVRGAWLRIRSR
jgi:N-acetylneuraminic acid mutarotase